MKESAMHGVMLLLRGTKMTLTPTRIKHIINSPLTTDTIARRLRKESAKEEAKISRQYIPSSKNGTMIAAFRWNA